MPGGQRESLCERDAVIWGGDPGHDDSISIADEQTLAVRACRALLEQGYDRAWVVFETDGEERFYGVSCRRSFLSSPPPNAPSASVPLRAAEGRRRGWLHVSTNRPENLSSERFELLRRQASELEHALGRPESTHCAPGPADALQQSLLSLPIPVAGIDGEGWVVACNGAFERLAGYSASELRDLTLGQLAERSHSRAYPVADLPHATEWHFQDKSGASRHVVWHDLTTAVSIPGWAHWGIAVDTTALSSAEETRDRLVTAVEHAAEAVVITDVEGVIQYVNPAFTTLTGYSAQEALGQTPRLLKSGQLGQTFYERLWETITRGEVWTGRMTNRKRDGSLYEEESSISPVRDATGTITGYVAAKRDVTRELELQRQLWQAQKLESIGTLAGGIAHDFNNVLSTILGYADLCLHDAEPGTGLYTNLMDVVTAARHARDLVGQILAFGRPQQMQRQPTALCPLVEEAVRFLRATLPSTIEIQLRLENRDAVVLIEPPHIQQIVTNLATNAAHAMPEGGRLSVCLDAVKVDTGAAQSRSGLAHYARLTISDTGAGMDESTLARIFDPYFTTKPQGKGSGLGLAVVHGIVTNSEGQVRAYSRPGAGSTFEILLPQVEEKSLPPSEPERSLPKGSGRILVVDDEPTLVAVSRHMLRHLGYEVDSFTDSLAALEAFRQTPERYRAVLTDQTMPGLTGLALAEEMLNTRPELPVILITGFSEVSVREERRKPCIRHLIRKPFTVKELADALHQVLQPRN